MAWSELFEICQALWFKIYSLLIPNFIQSYSNFMHFLIIVLQAFNKNIYATFIYVKYIFIF